MSGALSFRHAVIRAGFEVLSASGLSGLARPLLGGIGIVFTLHGVKPPRDDAFQPNRHLEISPDFLRVLLRHIRAVGMEIVTIDEAHRRLREREFGRRFACLTFDDGYRDCRDVALPIMRESEAPFVSYVTSEFTSGLSVPWWIAAERVISRSTSIGPIDGLFAQRVDCAGVDAKYAAFSRIAASMCRVGNSALIRRLLDELEAGSDMPSRVTDAEDCMSWDELRRFAEDPLVTIGAHGISHCNLAVMSEDLAAEEISGSRRMAEAMLSQPVRHFAFPYGNANSVGARELALAAGAGLSTAVTTRPYVLTAEDASAPMDLPRISINGNYQSERFLSVLTSGLATAAWRFFR